MDEWSEYCTTKTRFMKLSWREIDKVEPHPKSLDLGEFIWLARRLGEDAKPRSMTLRQLKMSYMESEKLRKRNVKRAKKREVAEKIIGVKLTSSPKLLDAAVDKIRDLQSQLKKA